MVEAGSMTEDQVETTSGVLLEVMKERQRQQLKFGVQNHDPFTWLSILGEEVGEANNAALEGHVWKSGHRSKNWSSLDNMREELVQVAAVAVAMVESIDRNGTEYGQ